jgi:hypothetical protein
MNSLKNSSPLIRLLCGAGTIATLVPGVFAQTIGPSTSSTPYLEASGDGLGRISFTSIRAVQDGPSKGLPQMVGIPDGLGAYDNYDGTFTLLMNHELGSTAGAVQDHGARGAFVSKWVVDKTTLEVKSYTDLIQEVKLWNAGTASFATPASPVALNRLCSGDLAPVTAFQSGGLGTAARIFLSGEEAGAEGRAFGHVATGPEAGTSYELASLGKFSWENAAANPFQQARTIVAGTDDGAGGQVYFYVGDKRSAGNEVEKAGLVGGSLYGLKLDGIAAELDSTVITAGLRFSLADLGDVSGKTGSQIDSASAGVTTGFQRPEDGAWNPADPSQFFFVTTDGSAATDRSRLWGLTFDDITDPTKGGVVSLLLDGTEGQLMMDNMTVSPDGKKILLQEDPGANNRLAKIWEYDLFSDTLTEIAQHSPALFSQSSSQGAFPFNRDEESSGIIPLWDILGPGYYALDVQAHTAANGTAYPGAVEHGQLLVMRDASLTPVPEVGAPGVVLVGVAAVAGLIGRRRASV